MKLVIGSYNVRGLGAKTARTKLKNVIQTTRPFLDILAVQEHKLRDTNIQFFTTNIWPQARVFHLPAADGAHAQRNPHVNGGRGGVLLAISPTIAASVTDHGVLPQNGGLWIHIDAPNGLKKAGITSRPGQTGSQPTDGGRVLKRLDRIYTDSTLLPHLHNSDILPASELSDHLLVLTTFHLGPSKGYRKSNYRMNIANLHDPKLKENIKQLWIQWEQKYEATNTSPTVALKSCIKRVAKLCQLWGKKAASKKKDKYNRLQLKVHGLLLQLQADPSNIYTQIKLETAQNDLNLWETEKARWTQLHLDMKWEEEGQRSSKLFFNSIKARKRQTTVHALQDELGHTYSEQDDMLQLAAEYFQEILQEPAEDPLQQSAVHELLSKTSAQVSNEERLKLQKDFSTEEMHTAAKLLGRNKCPGPDGVHLEFFLLLWDTVAPLLTKATTEAFQQDSLLPSFNRGVITLLPKDGDATLL
ncbi:hypothetical protein R1sor_026948 [Riccia sorocarpa]|uniref:Endonuclease/exonuclease/phosphatase domain-containing protein n=1 Tax=Riccia sorocarpa TaxID=122646 RepID=A0ABD3GG01_9MARC